MKKIACFGTEAFVLGFQLAGIRQTVIADETRLLDQLHELKEDPELGIVITEERLLATLEGDDRAVIEDSVEPVFIPLSTENSLGNIRKLIIKSIGVDLMKE